MSNRFHVPVFSGFGGFRAAWLPSDISAGLAIAAVGLPSAIAYPAIAGLPPETGLYASIAAPVAYAVFGPSHRMIVGPDAGTMTVLAAATASVIAAMPAAASYDRAAIAAVLALAVGGCCLAARLLRLGVLATFLSRPILVGFFAGISLSILVGQIGRFTGVSIEADGLFQPFLELLQKSADIHWPSLMLAGTMFVLLQIAAALRLPIPGPVIAIVVSVALSAVLDLKGMGVAVVGDIPSTVPHLSLPSVSVFPLSEVLLGAAAIFLVSFGSGIVTARSFATRTGEHVDANRELVGLGAANVAAAVFGAFPVSMSDSRTAINLSVGGKSQLAGLVSAAALLVTLLYLSRALNILPTPTLGAILAAAAISLIDVRELRQIWRVSRAEFVFALVTMWGAISLGVLNGVVIAIAATLAYLLLKMMFPRDALLGRRQGRDGFYKLHRTPDARPVPGFAVCMVQGSLLFFNADYVQSRIRTIVDELPEDTRWFVLDASAVVQIDSTAAVMLDGVRDDLARRGTTLVLAELHAEVRDLLERAGVLQRIGKAFVFDDLDDALRAFETEQSRIIPQETTGTAGLQTQHQEE
ncbi:SulP family inorganic anion transporter [Ensifer canadensis]